MTITTTTNATATGEDSVSSASNDLRWRRYVESDRLAWDSFLAQSRTPLFLFNRDFMEYHKDRFLDYSMLLYEKDSIVGIFPATRADDNLVSHGGLTYGGLLLSGRIKATAVLAALSGLIALLRAQGLSKLTYKTIPYIFHRQPAQDDLYALHRLGARIVRRDISSVIHLDARLRLSKGRKWMIARARKEKLAVSRSADWDRFHALLKSALARHGTEPVHSAAELRYLSSLFPEQIQLHVIETGGELLAATLLFVFDDVVHTQYIATSDAGKTVGALDFLIEELIERFAAAGKKYFSFGISTENQGQVLNEGLIAQKEGFGARGVAIDFYELNIHDDA
jgi:hypothetical protein